MSIKKTLIGTAISAAVSLAFIAAPLSSASAANDTVRCYGVNSCKGHSACKTAANACKGQNSCKGKGFEMKTSEQCKAEGGKTLKAK